MLVLFSKVAELEPSGGTRPSVEQLTVFCQAQVDYVATTHFGIYERIAEGKECRRQVVYVAGALYPRIKAITNQVSSFND